MDPARVVAGLVALALAAVTLASLERVLRHVEGRRPASAARSGALVAAFVGVALVVGL